jgi:hypothetical protein
VRLEEVASDEQLSILQQLPGVYSYDGNPRKGIPQGLYLPENLVQMGKLPGVLSAHEPHEKLAAPSGLLLHEYQRRAVTFLCAVDPTREGAILGADMGLGKSITAMQSLDLDGLLEQPGIVCGPLASRSAWVGEDADATRHFGMDIYPLEGKKDPDVTVLTKHKHVFIHYDILKPWVIWLTSTTKPAWIIFDESHLLMNRWADRSEAAYNLSLWATIQRRILLTGTPIPNTRLDLWHQLAIAQPRQWGTHKHSFGMRYCGGRREAHEEGGHFVYDSETNCTELRARLAGTYLRYTKADVASELPELERRVEMCDPGEDELIEYYRASTDIIGYLKEKGELETGKTSIVFDGEVIDVSAAANKPQAVRLRALSKLIGLLSVYKARVAVSEAIRMLDNHERVVVFTWRRDSAAAIVENLTAHYAGDKAMGLAPTHIFGPIDGTLKQKERQARAKAFAATDSGVYVATLGAAGISLNELSAASAVLFVDLHWNTSTLSQAESRVHRDGSKHDRVEAVYLVVKNTVDELFIQKLVEKANAAAGVAENDQSGLNLVADLMITNPADDGAGGLDDVCAMLAQMTREDHIS